MFRDQLLAALHTLEYLIALRIPLLAALFLLAFPWFAFTRGRPLFRGLFDLTPPSLFAVTLATYALAGTIAKTTRLVIVDGPARLPLPPFPFPWLMTWLQNDTSRAHIIWMTLMTAVCLPTIVYAVWLSKRQGRSLIALLSSAAFALLVGTAGAWLLMSFSRPIAMYLLLRGGGLLLRAVIQWPLRTMAHSDDIWIYGDHFSALCAFGLTFILWTVLGFYGWRRLGRKSTVPALASALLLITMSTWALAAVTFFLDRWHIPLLLPAILLALANTWIPWSDHTYELLPLTAPDAAIPTPAAVLTATSRPNLIVVAAEGGGILAAAWAAQVLEGLRDLCGKEVFDPSLRMISSVSGGSVGAACYIDWVLHPDLTKRPSESASASSLDEVAWGLTWPDALRAGAPLFFGWMADRGRALELTWSRNTALDPTKNEQMKRGLSAWLAPTSDGTIPAVIMNSTIVESGFRLLLGTSHLIPSCAADARTDGRSLHTINDVSYDVSVRTAARLSATFPWVTPAAKAKKGTFMPHTVDGGYYDNYGMATLVEWLDQAIAGSQGQSKVPIQRILILEIHSSPVTATPRQDTERNSGWFFQLVAPLLAVLNVRSAGQVAHNDIERTLLRDRWAARLTYPGVEILSIPFEFSGTEAPLSWHLTEEEKKTIRDQWNEYAIQDKARQVREFLASPNPNTNPSFAAASALR